jgi:histone H3/H4
MSEFITNAAIQRLARAAGIRTMSSVNYEEVRSSIIWGLTGVLTERCIKVAEFSGSSTVNVAHVELILREVSGPAMTTQTAAKMCKIMPESKSKSVKGMKAIEEIKFTQANSANCHMIPIASFSSLVRSIDTKSGRFRFSKEALSLMQFHVEYHTIMILKESQLVALNAKRVGVFPKDVQIVRHIRESK